MAEAHRQGAAQEPAGAVATGAPVRPDGYPAIADYAAIGDGRTVALVARDGSIDWLCLPDLDSPSVFAGLLDAERGGRFALEPEVPYAVERRYLPGTNVLQSTFSTDVGVVRVTDAMTLPTRGLAPYRELARRVEGIAGSVPMRWAVEPRFAYASANGRLALRAGVPVASAGRNAVAITSWGAGEAEVRETGVLGRFRAAAGTSALLALSAAHEEPLVFPARDDVERRLADTAAEWERWTAGRDYGGPWPEAVLRSALVLKLLVYAPSGAIAAAATTSLPEELGGQRNWDYRYSWPRDAAFTLQALLALGCSPEADAFFSWLMHASQLTHPRLHVLYRLDGGSRAPERELALAGYRGSRPVRVGNGAATQTQLDLYGEVMQAATLYADARGGLDGDQGRRLAGIADHVCTSWSEPDAGIWEVRSVTRHFTQSKMMCWVALDGALRLAADGQVPAKQTARWERERERVRDFVETCCYSPVKRSYVRSAGEEAVDAALLVAVLAGYDDPRSERLLGTVDAISRELAAGPFVYRYLGEDGVAGEDGAFLACSFWLVDALARQGRLDEAAALMEDLLGHANDVGLYAEEIDPRTGEFLGNFPQALVHLALINAAVSVAREGERR
jgi:GH15 family glucan-1,4-alpha-glucosidase